MLAIRNSLSIDSPNAIHNSTKIVATSVPVAVVPNAPSWKIRSRAPKVAESDKTLSCYAFNGNTTLPVPTISNTKAAAAITASTMGSRDVISSQLLRLICAIPVISACCRPDRRSRATCTTVLRSL
jgi:hypothetical protein